MNSTVSVSIIVPSYNCERYIEETLHSVIHQTVRNIEIIVIDDGSRDGQKAKILDLARQDSRIKYYYQDNKGVSAARNFGFLNSSGHYLAFLDSDDVWMPQNLEEKLKKFEQEDVGLVHSDALVIDENSVQTGEIMSGHEGNLLNGLLAWRETQIPGPSSILVRRDVIMKVGLFDTNLSTSADKDFFIRVAAHYAIGRVKKPTCFYRVHDKNMHKNIAVMERDVLYTYLKASNEKMFYSRAFERRCISNMYMILSASWFGDGRNVKRAFYFINKAIFNDITLLVKIPVLVLKKWIAT